MGERRRMSDPTVDDRRVHLLGIPCGQAKGYSHEGYRWTYARERVTCGGCRNTLAFKLDPAPSRPTVQVMGGETGESACLPGEDLYEAWQAALGTAETHYHFYDAVNGRGSFCPAPTPRAP